MIEPHAFKKLGGIPRTTDKQDFNMGGAGALMTHPAVYMQANAWNAPIYYQGKRPACGAHAAAWLNVLLNSYSGTTPNYTPRFTWIDIKKDGTSPSDGTDMRSIFKSLQGTGTQDFEPLENDVMLDDLPYATGTTSPTLNTVSNYAFGIQLSFDELKAKIYENRGVVLLMQVGDSMWTAKDGRVSWAEADILPLRPPSPIVDGHFVVAHSYDENYIYFANSWSTDWGRKGHGYFGPDYMLYVLETGTASTVAPWLQENLKKQVSILQQLIALYTQLFSKKH